MSPFSLPLLTLGFGPFFLLLSLALGLCSRRGLCLLSLSFLLFQFRGRLRLSLLPLSFSVGQALALDLCSRRSPSPGVLQ